MRRFLILTVTTLMLCACSSVHRRGFSHDEANGVYYWKTVFSPDSADIGFIKRHAVGRIYLRMFDVAVDSLASGSEDNTVPNATLRIPDDTYYGLKSGMFADIEFVPVVFITLKALKEVEGHEGMLARNLVTRVKNICSYNELPCVSGLQLDCDWTSSTEQSFFTLCDSVKAEFREQELPWRLSSTIRLHQLNRDAPPVDYGVLMVYNTGSFDDPDAANSILDEKDVKPYLKHLAGYPLHLDVAYPTYSWQLLFHKRRFVGLLSGVDVSDTAKFRPAAGSNMHQCIEDLPYKGMIICNGDIIRTETSAYQDIVSVKTLIEEQLGGRPHSNILYHFDLNNLSNYTDNEINDIFSAL